MKGNQRIALTKRLLQESLIRLMDQKPLEKISVTELCDEAGINRTTFYRHYYTPHDVLMDMEIDFNNRFIDSFNPANAKDISTYTEELLTYLYDNADLLKIFIKNNSADDLIHLLNDMFEKFLEAKSRFSVISDVDDENLRLISSYVTGGGYFMLQRWLVEDIHKSPKEIAELILTFMNYTAVFFDPNKNTNI
ncbi:MAG: TetR/AcrR family transcriptional regulator [Huintestinicola sp.]